MNTQDATSGVGARRWLMPLLAIVLAASACSSETSLAEWKTQWQAVVDQIPSVDMMLTADDASLREICSEAVGHLRAAASELEMAPDPDVGRAAITFVDFAEAVFFDCPISSGEHAGFAAGYEEMSRLIAVVDTLIAFDEG